MRINEQIGQRPSFDRLMYFCARWLVYIFIVAVIGWGWFWYQGETRVLFFVVLIAALVAAYAVSLAIGLFYPHQRPIKELPNVKTLVQTLGTWKSFPSDHTLLAFVMALTVMLFGAPVLMSIIGLLLASLIAFARVYAGVHYPRDIAGGLALAIVFSILSYFVIS